MRLVLVDFFDLGCVERSGTASTVRLRTLDFVRPALARLRAATVHIGVAMLSAPDAYPVEAVWQATRDEELGELIAERFVRSVALPCDDELAVTALRGLLASLGALDVAPLLVTERQRIRGLALKAGFRTARHLLVAETAEREATMLHGWMTVPVAWLATPPPAPPLLPLGPVVSSANLRQALAVVEADQVTALRAQGLVWQTVDSFSNLDADFELSYVRTGVSSGWKPVLRTDPPAALPPDFLPRPLDAPSVPPRCGGPILRFHATPALLQDDRPRPVAISLPDAKLSLAELDHIDRFVQEADIKNIVCTLAGLESRYVCSPLNCEAAALVRVFMEARVQPPASVSLAEFHLPQSVGGARRHNIVAELNADPQSPTADEIVVVSAHYDAITMSASCLQTTTHAAPGADDNASGVAIVLTVARALARAFKTCSPQRTVRLILFNCEEVDLAGSGDYLGKCASMASKSRIVAGLNVDMAGIFASGGQHCVEVNPGGGSQASSEAQELTLFVRRVVAYLAASKRLRHVGTGVGDPTGFVKTNDAMSFHRHQIPACTVSEWFGDDKAGVGPHPTWHSIKDVAARVDASYLRDLAMIVCAAALRLAQPDELPKSCLAGSLAR